MGASDKEGLRDQLVALIDRDRRQMTAAQRLTSEGVTHEDGRAEGSKDMRATEAAYIARGQAQRAEALASDLARVRAMPLRAFGPGEPIALSAVVVIADDAGDEQTFFVAPAGGGALLDRAGTAIRVVTPSAPLGRALVGASVGDVVTVTRAGRAVALTIEEVR